jgi:AcrR family transcriptional regulator
MNASPASMSRERILEEALSIMRREDVDGITMRGLAQRIGHSAASLYLHFQGKEEIEREVARHALRELEQALAPSLAIADPREALAGFVRGYVQFGLSHPKLYRLMFQDLAQLRTLDRAGDPALGRVRASLHQVYERGIATGAFRPVDSAAAMAVCWAMAHGFVQLALAQRLPGAEGAAALARLLEALVDTMLRSLRA